MYKIKQLVWELIDHVHFCNTDNRYRVWEVDGKVYCSSEIYGDPKTVDSVEEGKALCQQHYNEQALEFLEEYGGQVTLLTRVYDTGYDSTETTLMGAYANWPEACDLLPVFKDAGIRISKEALERLAKEGYARSYGDYYDLYLETMDLK